MTDALLNLQIRYEQDVVATRQRARQIASLLGMSVHDQTAFATAVSEIARNAFRYARGGRATFSIRTHPAPAALVAQISDDGPGIADVSTILNGQYVSTTGMGRGIVGTRRLADEFDIVSTAAGTRVTLASHLPARTAAPSQKQIESIIGELAKVGPRTPLEEVQQQNRELLETVADVRRRRDEIERLNAELAETNRGVLALYAELDEKAESLQKASALKTRFLSDMTHELRTPLNAVVSLSGLLLDRTDGDLTSEQEKQVALIRRSSQSLLEMVSDLLDIARIEAGKVDLHVSRFDVNEVLLALRGMFRPLVPEGAAALVIEEALDVPLLETDERKLSQILRNLIANALKFTERGEVRVATRFDGVDSVLFRVSDTGIGIAAENLPLIFQDFAQIDNPIQRRLRGSGLGLPLSRKLARILGGDVTVESVPERGSAFTLRVPLVCTSPPQVDPDATGTGLAQFAGGAHG